MVKIGFSTAWRRAALFALPTLLGLALRLGPIHESLWLDELHTSWSVAGPFSDIDDRARQGNNSPLYFWIVGLITSLLGQDEWSLRLVSVLAGTALIYSAQALSYQCTNRYSAALLVGTVAAIDPNFSFYSLEARPYALVQWVSLLHVIALMRRNVAPMAATRQYAARAAWIILASLNFALHYSTILLLPAHLIYTYVHYWYRGRRPEWRRWCVDLAIFASLGLPVLPHIYQVAQRRDNWQQFVPHQPVWHILTIFPAIALLLPVIVVAIAAFAGRRRHPSVAVIEPEEARDGKDRMLLWLCVWLIPLGIAWGLNESDAARIFFRRYLMGGAIAPVMLAGQLCASIPSRHFRVAATLITIGIAAWPLADRWRHSYPLVSHSPEDWSGAIGHLNRELERESAAVFVLSQLIECQRLVDRCDTSAEAYCLLPVGGLYRIGSSAAGVQALPSAAEQIGGHSPSIDLLQQVDTAWFLLRLRRLPGIEYGQRVQAALRRSGIEIRIRSHTSFGNVQLFSASVARSRASVDRSRASVDRSRRERGPR